MTTDHWNNSLSTLESTLQLLEVSRRRAIRHLSNLKQSYQLTKEDRKQKNSRRYHLERIKREIRDTSHRILRLEEQLAQVRPEFAKALALDVARQQKELEERTERENLEMLKWVESTKKPYDVFVSHASSDKEEFVRPLAAALVVLGVRVWFDEFELKVGDSLRKSIDFGLANSKFGLIVLSTSFFNRPWTEYELNGFTSRELHEGKVIIPIWHKITKDEVIRFSPPLADKVALKSSDLGIEEIAARIAQLLG